MTDTQRGKATCVLPFGVIVQLEDGREGFLPRREFAATTTRDLRELVKPGEAFEAVVGGESRIDRPLLRLASGDGWDRFVAEYQPGTIVNGVVRGVEPYGVFVDLPLGVAGLVKREELAAWPIEKVEEALSLSDTVKVVVQSVARQEEHVTLSIRQAAAERNRELKLDHALVR